MEYTISVYENNCCVANRNFADREMSAKTRPPQCVPVLHIIIGNFVPAFRKQLNFDDIFGVVAGACAFVPIGTRPAPFAGIFTRIDDANFAISISYNRKTV